MHFPSLALSKRKLGLVEVEPLSFFFLVDIFYHNQIDIVFLIYVHSYSVPSSQMPFFVTEWPSCDGAGQWSVVCRSHTPHPAEDGWTRVVCSGALPTLVSHSTRDGWGRRAGVGRKRERERERGREREEGRRIVNR